MINGRRRAGADNETIALVAATRADQCGPAVSAQRFRSFIGIANAARSLARTQPDGYSSPLETVIESYSLPSTEDVDPTIAVSLFYYFMFGLMLSDAGYGFIIFMASLLGLVMFKDNLKPGLKKTLKIYIPRR